MSCFHTDRAPGLPPSILPAGRKPPGPPPGTPPELSDSEEEDNFADNTTKQRKIRFADADPVPEQEEQIGDSSLHLGEKFTGGFTSDATRFVPTALKVRRIVRDTNGRLVTTGGGTAAYGTGRINSGSATSKDDAYEEFMREMEGLI
ncbi:unnamed protein product [Schistosoma curassoni]|uniref:Uncharacterized protein n=1 Tax=Schistosoma curassoni TaxID=6186 RepID=A0A3P8KET4_9TREM|nr:unnamed protein product [Schistosoma curassoni]